MRAVGDRVGILAPDVAGRKLDIQQSSMNLRMAHQMLESGQGDTSPDHIRSECMAATPISA